MNETNEQRRVRLTNSIMALLDNWGTNSEQKMAILGLPTGIRGRKLERFRRDEAFPDNETVNEHLEHIVGIADALRTTFPRNAEMCNLWLHQPHRRLGDKTPLEVIVSKGLPGLIQVRSQLDCSFAWNATGSV